MGLTKVIYSSAFSAKSGLFLSLIAGCLAVLASVHAEGHDVTGVPGEGHDRDCGVCLLAERPHDSEADLFEPASGNNDGASGDGINFAILSCNALLLADTRDQIGPHILAGMLALETLSFRAGLARAPPVSL